ncbi:MAG TPA: hypothetical protein VMU51_10700 [Mycobacteriales bacterium]|nr:hypothetical protein [Mycobacteriales bacterium]
MRWLSTAAAGTLAVVLAAAPAAATGVGGAPTAVPAVAVAMDRPAVSAVLGDRFTVRSTLVNTGAAATGPLLAHLDVVSLHNDVYVDPEDWSSDRSVDVEPLAPAGRSTLEWTVRTVDAGEFDVYVVVLPAGSAATLSVSPALRLAVASRQTLDPGGSAVLVVTVPVLIGAFVLGGRLFRRRRRPGRDADPAPADAPRR